MQQAEHQRDPRRRQPDAAIKRACDQGEDRQFERAELAEIRRRPFADDTQQLAKVENLA